MSSLPPDETSVNLDPLLRRLQLGCTRQNWRKLVEQAQLEEWSHERFLTVLLMEEVTFKQQRLLTSNTRAARFPFLKTLDDFDFSYQTALSRKDFSPVLTDEYIREGRNLVLSGGGGVGKTHLAIAMAYQAIQNGYRALFVTVDSLLEELIASVRSGLLNETVSRFLQPDVLVLDELGYRSYGPEAANHLFGIVKKRQARLLPVIATTVKRGADLEGGALGADPTDLIYDTLLRQGELMVVEGVPFGTDKFPGEALRALADESVAEARVDSADPTENEPAEPQAPVSEAGDDSCEAGESDRPPTAPLQPPPLPASQRFDTRTTSGNEQLTVLVVQDDEVAREILDYHLGRAGFDVRCAEDGEQARHLLDDQQFDAAVLDIHSRIRSGFELLEEIRHDDRKQSMKVVLLSSQRGEEDEIKAFNLGANDYVVKPFSPRVLVARLMRFLPSPTSKEE